MKLVDFIADADLAVSRESPSGLLQCEATLTIASAKLRRTLEVFLEESFVAFVDSFGDLLDCLRTKKIPMLESVLLLPFGDLLLKSELTKVFTCDSIVSSMYSYTFIPDLTSHLDLMVKVSRPSGTIELKFEGTNHHFYPEVQHKQC